MVAQVTLDHFVMVRIHARQILVYQRLAIDITFYKSSPGFDAFSLRPPGELKADACMKASYWKTVRKVTRINPLGRQRKRPPPNFIKPTPAASTAANIFPGKNER
jgi:hypothetical protein